MSHPLFGPELRQMLLENDTAEMRTFCETLHPATIAEALAEDFTVEEAWRVLEHTSIRNQAAIFEYFPNAWQVQMAESTGRPHMARLIEQMSHDDRVDLLRRLSPRVAESLLRLVDDADRRDIADLFRYQEDTVGAMMTTDYARLPMHLTAGEALDRLRQQAPDRETIYYVYILEEPSRRLTGVVTLRNLVLAQRQTPLRELMETDLITLRVDQPRREAAEEMAKYDLIALPVVDEHYRLVGIVTHDDVIDVVVQEATEDLQRQGAAGTFTTKYLEVPYLTIWRKRTFWLSCIFLAGLLTFSAMEAFEESIDRVKVLTFFLPLCLATGGNSGTQAATLITRELALGHIGLRDWFRVLRHEVLIGIAMGMSLALLGVARSFLVDDRLLVTHDGDTITHAELGVAVGMAIGTICLAGTLIGAMLPLAFKRIGVDPGLASSPFVSTFVDVTGIIIFFSIARAMLMG